MVEHAVAEHHFFPDVEGLVKGSVELFATVSRDLGWVEESLRDLYMGLPFYDL